MKLLFTNEEYQLAQRFLAHPYDEDPTLEYPELTDVDEPVFGTDDAFPMPRMDESERWAIAHRDPVTGLVSGPVSS